MKAEAVERTPLGLSIPLTVLQTPLCTATQGSCYAKVSQHLPMAGSSGPKLEKAVQSSGSQELCGSVIQREEAES